MNAEHYEGKLCRSYCVKQRTFESYMRTLRLEGRLIYNDHNDTWWTPATWAQHVERMKEEMGRKEEIRIRNESGKLEEYLEMPRTG